MERNWKLDDDLSTQDNIFDPITFDELILTVHCNCRVVNHGEIVKTAKEILESRLEDFWYLIENNSDEIRELALVGREGGRE